jgi:hypothetical protein
LKLTDPFSLTLNFKAQNVNALFIMHTRRWNGRLIGAPHKLHEREAVEFKIKVSVEDTSVNPVHNAPIEPRARFFPARAPPSLNPFSLVPPRAGPPPMTCCFTSLSPPHPPKPPSQMQWFTEFIY